MWYSVFLGKAYSGLGRSRSLQPVLALDVGRSQQQTANPVCQRQADFVIALADEQPHTSNDRPLAVLPFDANTSRHFPFGCEMSRSLMCRDVGQQSLSLVEGASLVPDCTAFARGGA